MLAKQSFEVKALIELCGSFFLFPCISRQQRVLLHIFLPKPCYLRLDNKERRQKQKLKERVFQWDYLAMAEKDFVRERFIFLTSCWCVLSQRLQQCGVVVLLELLRNNTLEKPLLRPENKYHQQPHCRRFLKSILYRDGTT